MEAPEPYYCITVPDPHEIVIQPANSKHLYSTLNCNFSLLFGASFKRFAQIALETQWDEQRIENFISERGLSEKVDAMMMKYTDVGLKLCKYYAVADYIRNTFFDTYPGLMNRMERNKEFAKTNGYLRSFHGAFRRVPMLYLNYNSETEKTRWDDDPREIAEYNNITANSTIQTDEVSIIMGKMIEWENANTILVGNVHDSIDAFIKKVGAVDTIRELIKHFEANDGWQRGLKVPVDVTIVDFKNPDHYYKNGYEWKEFLQLHASTN